MFCFRRRRPREPKADIPEHIPWARKYLPPDGSALALGMSAAGRLELDLKQHPHVLVAGENGSGKSALLRSMAWQMGARDAMLYLIDCKCEDSEFGPRFEALGEVVTDSHRALTLLHTLCDENAARRALFHESGVTELSDYNARRDKRFRRIALVIDELAFLQAPLGAESEEIELAERRMERLAALMRMSRGTGIHVFIGVQRPDVTLLSRELRDGLPARICGRFTDRAPSKVVLGSTLAMDLPPVKGRFLLRAGGALTEFQTYWFKDKGF